MKDLLARRVELARRKQSITADLEEVAAAIRELDAKLMLHFDNIGLQNVTTDEGPTVSLQSVLTCRHNHAGAAKDIYQAKDGFPFLMISTGSVKARAREAREVWEEAHGVPYDGDITQLLPPEIQAAVSIDEVRQIRVTGA